MADFVADARVVFGRLASIVTNPLLSRPGRIRCLATKPWRWSQVELRGGWRVGLATNEDRATFHDIFFEESYRSLDYLDATVVDIGAHKGMFALYALLRGARRVVLLECEPDNVRAIMAMIKRNGLEYSVRLIDKAAWSEVTSLNLRVSDENWAHSVVDAPKAPSTRTVTVQTTTLRDILADAGTGRVAVKSNCEGAEVEVVKDVPPMVREAIVSYHHWSTLPLPEFQARLHAQGFDVSVLSQNREHTNLFCKR